VSSVPSFVSIIKECSAYNYSLCWNVTDDETTLIRVSRISVISIPTFGSCTASDSPSGSPSSSPLSSPSSSPSVSPTLPCTPGKDCLRCSAHCYTRRDPTVNNLDSYNFKENNRDYFTLKSFREFTVGALFLPGTNEYNKQVSWAIQVNTTRRIGQPQLFDILDCESNRSNQTVAEYRSGQGERMKVTVKTLVKSIT